MRYAFVAIGASLGGLQAVKAVLSALPASFALPLALAQHRTADAGDALAYVLRDACALPVREVEDKTPIEAGTLFLAPPGYHLLVEGDHFALSTEDAWGIALPSIDVLFETAAEAFGRRLIGVVLSGTGTDGMHGLAAIAAHGGTVIVESPQTAFAPQMPQAAAQAASGALRLAGADIGPKLAELARMR